MSDNELVELFAKEAHERWSVWVKIILKTEKHISPRRKQRWLKLANTPYEKLTEMQKEDDRIHARRVVSMIKKFYDSKGMQLC